MIVGLKWLRSPRLGVIVLQLQVTYMRIENNPHGMGPFIGNFVSSLGSIPIPLCECVTRCVFVLTACTMATAARLLDLEAELAKANARVEFYEREQAKRYQIPALKSGIIIMMNIL